jgi:RHS repeat-associated protein
MEQVYASGNTLYDGNNEYWYDAEGQLCAVQSQRWPGAAIIQYIYDAEGARIGKGTLASAPGSYTATCAPPFGSGFTLTNRYLVDLGGDQVTELNGSGVWQHSNVWAGGKLVATYDTKGIHFELTDPLGTKRVQANAQGQVDETCTSLPFGNEVGNSPGANCVQPGNPLGTGDDATEHHFTQKERDTETGNDYFLARYYSSALGRFTTPDWSAKTDPVPYAAFANPQSLNLYAYVRNNPITAVDSDGHDFIQQQNQAWIIQHAMTSVNPGLLQAAGVHPLSAQQQATVPVTVSDVSSAPLGHSTIQVGNGPNVGLVPDSEAQAAASTTVEIVSAAKGQPVQVPIPGHVETLGADRKINNRAVLHVTSQQAKAMQATIDQAIKTLHVYDTGYFNCAHFTESVLRSGGVNAPLDMTPTGLVNDLNKQNPQ